MTVAIETHSISKRYGTVLAVNAVDLRVEAGEIYGFLGLNGAGKSTTIRALLGLIRPSCGSVRVLGEPVGPNGRGPWSRVGHMVETPTAYPELTVRENLEAARRLHSLRDRAVVSRALERLNLGAYADRRAGTLSTGNLQRLGLARALLHTPELLILDEPTNGLDPAGVVEIRELLSGIARERGVTVFMSSHILPEVDRLAMRIGIIHQGRLIEELAAEKMDRLRSRRLIVETRRIDTAERALSEGGYAVERVDGRLVLSEPRTLEAPDEVASLLVRAAAPPTRLSVEQEDLETYFLKLTGGVR